MTGAALEQQPQPAANGADQSPGPDQEQQQRPLVEMEELEPEHAARPDGSPAVSPSLMVRLESEVDLEADPTLPAANAVLFKLRDRIQRIDAALAAIDADERLSESAKANDKTLVVGTEAPKPLAEVEGVVRDLLAARRAADQAWQKTMADGGDSPRMVQGEAEVRGMARDMAASERVAFVSEAIRAGDALVVRAMLLSPSARLTGLSAEQLEALRRQASNMIDPTAARRRDALRTALLRVRGAASAYGTACRSRGASAEALPRWLVSSADTWTDDLPPERGQRR